MVTIKEFTCERCGNKFETTAKHAKYCPECREIKKLERIQAHKEKQKAGTARRVGTEQICPNCGKSFILKSGSQKICVSTYCAVQCILVFPLCLNSSSISLHSGQYLACLAVVSNLFPHRSQVNSLIVTIRPIPFAILLLLLLFYQV